MITDYSPESSILMLVNTTRYLFFISYYKALVQRTTLGWVALGILRSDCLAQGAGTREPTTWRANQPSYVTYDRGFSV